MPQIGILDTIKVTAHFTRADEELVNVWHVKSDPLSDAEIIALETAFLHFYTSGSADAVGSRGIVNFLDASVVMDRLVVQWVDVVPYGDPVEVTLSQAGTGAGDCLPLQTALCVTLRTGTSARRARGRVFLGGFSEASNDEGDGYPRPTAALQTAVVNGLNDLMDAIRAVQAGTSLAVASYTYAEVRPVTSIKVKNVWATQKRRAKSVPITASTLVLNT